ncbi:MAG TPA: hypothetical protein VGJ71_12035, partial [Candidatus Limnocylindrales bacterium]
MGHRRLLRVFAATLALSAGLALPASVLAHPLGNFTINHYAGLTIGTDRIWLDVVIDMAEIPAFQERQDMDTDGDGSVGDGEGGAWAGDACAELATNLRLTRDGAALPLPSGTAAVSFPPGAGGLSTLRLECGYTVTLAPIDGSTEIAFSDPSYHDRIGWHEIIAFGQGTTLNTRGLPTASPTHRLTSYPTDLVAAPLDVRSATITVTPAPGSSAAPGGARGPIAGATPTPPDSLTGAVPGGVGGELPDIFRTADLTPLVILASLLAAVVIGAGHALTPGHGKTLMAAYLVGSRGSPVHAVGLGMSVAVSHTLGILALALVIVGAGSILPPDLVYRVTPVIAAVSIVAIGGWMLVNEVRRRRAAAPVTASEHDHDHTHEHPHPHEHEHEHERGHAHEHPHLEPDASEHAHPHESEHPHPHVEDA